MYYYLYSAYSRSEQWDRHVLQGAPESAYELADQMLIYKGRIPAAELQHDLWMSGSHQDIDVDALRCADRFQKWSQLSTLDQAILQLTADSAPRSDERIWNLSQTYARELSSGASRVVSTDLEKVSQSRLSLNMWLAVMADAKGFHGCGAVSLVVPMLAQGLDPKRLPLAS